MSYFKNTPESLLEKVKEIQKETAAREGNKFTKALMAARENGKKFFTVNGKEYETEALDDKDKAVIKKVAGKLKGASQAHAGQSKDLEKALSDEVKYPHDMFDPKTGKKEVAKNIFSLENEVLDLNDIKDIPIFIIEGKNDDISAPGQCLAALEILKKIPDNLKFSYLHENAGHYGIFSGKAWRTEIRPLFLEFIDNKCS